MPNFAINGSSPVRVSQASTDAGLIRNTGNSAVFLDKYSSVTSANYGLELQPFDSVNWSGSDLWAVSAPGDTSTLSVLYGADGVSLGAVSAVVTGDVTATIDGPVDANILGTVTVDGDVSISGPVTASISGTVPVDIQNAVINADVTGNIIVDSGEVNVGGILTPVQVQGGGSVLVNTTGTLTPGGSINISIPAPASGLTYAGLGVIVTNTSKSVVNIVPLTCYIYNNGVAISNPSVFQASIITGTLGEFGACAVTKLVVPVGAAFPLRITLDHNGATSNLGYRVIVVGLSYADTLTRDFGQWENGAESEVSYDNAAANSFATIAASFETRQFLLVSPSGTVGNFNVDVLLSNGTWQGSQLRVQNNVYGNITPSSEVQPNVNSILTIPGDGRIHRVRNGNAVTGFVRLTYIGKIT